MKKVEDKLIPKTEDEFDAEDIKKVENYAKAINMLYCAVNPDDYRKISCCSTAKEMWDKLEVTYEGRDQVREAKIGFLTQEYEMFRMKEHEKIDDMLDRFSKIVNDLHALKKTYTDRDLVQKILRSLTSEWRSKADVIYESIGTSNVTIDGLRGNLKTYESTIFNPSLNDQRKGITLKAVKESTMDDSSVDDEVKLVMKKFCKLLRKKEKVEDGPVCYGCGEAGHIKNKCPKSGRNARHFKRQKAYISWGGDSGDESTDQDEDEVANLCLMAHEDQTDDVQEKKSSTTTMVQTRSNANVGTGVPQQGENSATGGRHPPITTGEAEALIQRVGITAEQFKEVLAALAPNREVVVGDVAGGPIGEKAGPAGSQGKKRKLEEEDESSSFERMSAFDRLGDPKSKKPRTSAFERLQDTRSARKGDLRDALKEKRGESTATSKNPYHQAVFSEVTPFSRRIMSCPLPDNFKTPQIKAYNGTTDPQDHLARFGANVVMYAYPEEIKCRCFLATLEGQACEWFHKLPKGSIDKWGDLAHKFLEHFASSQRQKLPFSHLLNVKIRKGEQLREFINRWEMEARDVQGADDQALIAMLQAALPQGDVRKELRRNPLSTYQEMLARAKYLALEEEDDEPPVQKEKKSGPPVAEGKKRKDYGKGPNPTGYHANRHPVHAVQSLPAPPHGRESYGVQDAPKYCEYNRNSTHNTSECVTLKKEIDQLIARGPPPRSERPSTSNRTWRRPPSPTAAITAGEGQEDGRRHLGRDCDDLDEEERQGRRHLGCRFIMGGNTGGDSVSSRKKWKNIVYLAETLVDTGNSVNVMYSNTFKELGLSRSDLKLIHTPLSGFTGDTIEAEGTITVKAGVGDGTHRLWVDMEFMVVQLDCAHHLILGRPGLEDLECVISPVHLCLKFNTPIGVGVAKGNQSLSRSCYVRATKSQARVDENVSTICAAIQKEEGRPRAEPAEEVEEVSLDPVEPERKVKVGKTLPLELKEQLLEVLRAFKGNWWTVYTDGSSATDASGGGVVAISPEGFKAYYSVRFRFKVSNNEAEYEALLCGLRLAASLKAERIQVRCDSKLVEEELLEPSISPGQVLIITLREKPDWIDEITMYILDGSLLIDPIAAKVVKRRAPSYTLECGRLYKRLYNGTLLRCLRTGEAQKLMEEIHEGICSAHQGAFTMSRKVTLQGYFWPTIIRDCAEYVRKCKVCQEFQRMPGRPATNYTPISTAIPFARWGIDLVGILPRGTGNNTYLVVAIDYFTKWVEAAPVPTITAEQMTKFVSKQILCRFGVPQQIITDNGTQFEAGGFNEFLQSWGHKTQLCSGRVPTNQWAGREHQSYHHGWPQEEDNGMQKCLGGRSALYFVDLQNYPKEGNRVETFDAQGNEENLRAELHLIDERRERAYMRAENYRRQVKSYHDQRVRPRQFKMGDWVLRKREVSRPTDGGKFAKSFEGPYIIKEVLADGTFRLQTPTGGDVPRVWNAANLIKFYQ
ncbi:unnamed protein product [Cuscuta campestris]|uniref:Uncharacterized protein n=1 Tax=Cuscuta campestris TaxID=132261 RepID=A0A484N3S7_9ASTE|nr:unnamed protein product [Cuscuta campestris]